MVQPQPSPSMAPRSVLALGGYLVLITALVRLGTSLYLPALPRMGLEMQLSAPLLSSTMTAYLAAFAGASIFLGPVSDRWGRQILIRGGIAVFLLGSVFCAVANGIAYLLAGRVCQAIGGAAVQVAARAMSRDAFDDHQMIRVVGWIGVITGLVPILAPVLGGFITQGWGWRANFYLLIGATLLVGVGTHKFSAETLSHGNRPSLGIAQTLRAYAAMLGAASFLVPLLPVMLCFAAQGAYLVGSPFIFIHLLGLSPAVFGATSLLPVASLLTGRFLCLAILKRRGDIPAFVTGGLLAFVGGFLFWLENRMGWNSAAPLLMACSVFCLGFGAVLPIGMKAGLSAFPRYVGTSSALFGCLTLGATAVGSSAVGHWLQQTERDITTLATFTLLCGGLAFSTSLLYRRSQSKRT